MSSPADDDVYRGWRRPGPRPPGGLAPEEGETLDSLCGHWRIFQLHRGHRYSSDDVLCAWYGSSHAPRVERACDLGSGIGSVALTVAWRLPGARFVTLEAQEMSLRLAKKSVRFNGVEDRFTVLHGDLRDPDALARVAHAGGPFDLVTGTPPYWPVGAALPAHHPQAVPARLEVRGDILDYARAAARLLGPGGVFATVFPAAQDERVRRSLVEAGLVLVRTRAVQFKEGVPAAQAGLCLYLSGKRADLPASFPLVAGVVEGKPLVEPPLVIRRPDGTTHPAYAAVRLSFGFPPGDMPADGALAVGASAPGD